MLSQAESKEVVRLDELIVERDRLSLEAVGDDFIPAGMTTLTFTQDFRVVDFTRKLFNLFKLMNPKNTPGITS